MVGIFNKHMKDASERERNRVGHTAYLSLLQAVRQCVGRKTSKNDKERHKMGDV